MTKFLFGAATAALALAIPAVASAQQLPAAVIAVVDVPRILQSCTACVAANTALRTQAQQIEQRAQQLNTPLETEANAIRAALTAANNTPDAALQARIRTFESQRETAQREVATRQQQLERNGQYVLQQIQQRLDPIVSQVMTQRGASIAIDRRVTMSHNAAIEVTDAVLALLNTQLPSVNVNAPPPAQQPAAAAATPGQRPATPPAQPQRRPRRAANAG